MGRTRRRRRHPPRRARLGHERVGDRQRRRHAARLSQHVREVRRRARQRPAARWHAHLRHLRGVVRPAARRAQHQRRRAPARSGAAASQQGHGQGRAVGRDRPAAPRCRSERRARGDRALPAVPVRPGRRPPPPAAPLRATDRVRVRDVLVDALGRGRVPARGRADAVARRLRAGRRAVGRPADPDRPGVRHALEHDRNGRRAVPQPGRRDGVRGRPVRRGPRCATPIRSSTGWSPTRRRW